MARIVAVTACPTGIAHTYMAAEALQRAARAAGHSLRVETQGSVGAQDVLTPDEIEAADAVILAVDASVDRARFAGKRLIEVSTSEAIRNAPGVLEQAVGSAAAPAAAPAQTGELRIVGITSCPTGIAHTFMAAEGLEGGARTLGHTIKVETQGSVGAGNALTPQDIAQADLVVIAADTNVDLSRFAGKRLYQTGTKPAIKDGAAVIRQALEQARPHGAAAGTAADASGREDADYLASIQAGKSQRKPQFSAYRHLMTGVSFMLPFVVAGGLLIALAFAIGGIYVFQDQYAGTLGNTLFKIGSNGAFGLFIPVLAGYIAFSIADRPGLAPGMVGGFLAVLTGSGFLGGIAAGFLAGYITFYLNRGIRLPRTLEGLKPTLILPLLGTLLTGLLMMYVVGTPVATVMTALTEWLRGLQSTSAGVLGALLGAMMSFDMGGPLNKAAYTFSTGLLGSEVYGPMAAAMVAGMTPPLGLALASWLFKNRFTTDEREAGKAAAVLGLAFITEGAIPFAARDPLRVIPSLVVGSAVAGAISMIAGCTLRVPHGGVFVLFIPNAVTNLPMYIVALLTGTVITALMLLLLKRPLAGTPRTQDAPVAAD
ncbi:PTS system fructose-specific IIC component [Deinobacterium chartae]|uniref:PTS system fructose-specific IIC component n=1 Tax=Deinobacterium chartae TaxID=521158 RepID=A0A841I485_9DEIO|nr:PTS fructose-like transporter subunit IIB [Deinobacterium chartae]MBB6099208.1 PTS system fructose-specific IIC component [Deinobacterium chartae]